MSERNPLQIPLRLRYATLIREWRAQNGLSLADFERQVGLRRQYLWTLESGASFTLKSLEPILACIRGEPYDPPLLQQVGSRLKQVRTSKGWSQELLSERCGTSIQHVSKMERGAVNATLDALDAVVTQLGLTGEFAIEGLEGHLLEERLAAVWKSYHAFELAANKAGSSDA